MAWRLCENGFPPVAVIVEKRGRMAGKTKESLFSLLLNWGFGFVFRKVLETTEIKIHYWCRRILKGKFKSSVYRSIEEVELDYPIEVYYVDDHNSIDTVRLIEHLDPDVGVLTNTRRIHKQVLSMAKHGFLNLHLSALPKYGGLESIFWALYHGEKEIGVTVHCVSEGIDEGAIVLQRKIPVMDLDDEESLYTKALWLGTAMMVKALKQLTSGNLERRPQEKSEASYFSWPTKKERAILRKRRKPLLRSDHYFANRVVHVITRMTRGGAQENTLATLRGLKARGYEVTLITGPSWQKEGEILSEALEEGFDIIILPELVREISLWDDFVASWKLFRLLARSRCVIVHAHTSKAGLLGRIAARLAKIPIIIHTPHGHVFHSYFSKAKERFFIFLERRLSRHTTRLIALTETCRKEHLELGIGKPGQWAVIPSGVNEDCFKEAHESRKSELRQQLGIGPDKKIVGFIGRLTPIKGPRFLTEAIPEIRKALPESHFLFVGDGEEKESIKARVAELGEESSVVFVGHQDSPADFLSVMDVLVVPSLNEGMGRVIVEAGFLGKPVVGTNVGGIVDLIRDGETGLLIKPGDPKAITEAVIRFLRDPSWARRIGLNLREKVLNGFTEKQMIEKMDELYHEEMKKKNIR